MDETKEAYTTCYAVRSYPGYQAGGDGGKILTKMHQGLVLRTIINFGQDFSSTPGSSARTRTGEIETTLRN